MDKLILLVGESGSGKTTIGYELEKQGLGKVVDTYTTRPPRHEGEQGHIFSDHATYQQHRELGLIIASTEFHGNFYWGSANQYLDQGTTIWIVDPNGVRDLKNAVKDAEIIVIHLKCDELVRRLRMSEERGFSEALQRVKHDREAFKIIQCDYCIDANRPIEEVLELVKAVIG